MSLSLRTTSSANHVNRIPNHVEMRKSKTSHTRGSSYNQDRTDPVLHLTMDIQQPCHVQSQAQPLQWYPVMTLSRNRGDVAQYLSDMPQSGTEDGSLPCTFACSDLLRVDSAIVESFTDLHSTYVVHWQGSDLHESRCGSAPFSQSSRHFYHHSLQRKASRIPNWWEHGPRNREKSSLVRYAGFCAVFETAADEGYSPFTTLSPTASLSPP